MNKYKVKQISNGWILQGWIIENAPTADKNGLSKREIFLLTIHAVADVLTTWEASGFPQAATRAKDKWGTG